MEIVELSSPLPQLSVIFSFGIYDGVHLGHQYLLSLMRALSQARALPVAVMTFIDPPKAISLELTSRGRRRALLERQGVDLLVELPFSQALQRMGAKEFLQMVSTLFSVDTWVVGSDVGFGKGREGDKNLLCAHALENNQRAVVVERLCHCDQELSSSRIRELLLSGREQEASVLLGL